MNYMWKRNSPEVRFTYKNSYNYNPSPARPTKYQINDGPRPRTGSLPPQKEISHQKPDTIYHNKITHESSFNQRKRKHRIFQESPLVIDNSTSKSRTKNHTIFGEYKRNSLQKTPQKQTQSKQIQTQIDDEVNNDKKVTAFQQKLNRFGQNLQHVEVSLLNQRIDDRLSAKLNVLSSKKIDQSLRESSNKQMVERQQQIAYLKLQVERLKRCQKLNKQNQCLYKKLVARLKIHSKKQKINDRNLSKKIISTSNSPRKMMEKQTPINSLYDLKKIEPQISQTSLIYKPYQSQKKNDQFTNSQHQIMSPQQLLVKNGKIQDFQHTKQQGFSKQVTFNTQIPKKHSKRMKMQIYPTILQIKQQILYQEASKQAISQIQHGNRLQELNSHLQRKMSIRSTSRPNKEANQSITNYSTKTSIIYRNNPLKQTFLY